MEPGQGLHADLSVPKDHVERPGEPAGVVSVGYTVRLVGHGIGDCSIGNQMQRRADRGRLARAGPAPALEMRCEEVIVEVGWHGREVLAATHDLPRASELVKADHHPELSQLAESAVDALLEH